VKTTGIAGPVAATRKESMSIALYVFGYWIVMSGLIYGAVMMQMPTRRIVVAATLWPGTGVIAAVTSTCQKDHVA
jgi:hypothetical protein